MMRCRLRTKFLLWMVVISAGVTTTTLLLVRNAVEDHLRTQIVADLHNSVSTFKDVELQRQKSLRHTAELVANLPISRALMTTRHAATIQDGSADLWRLAGSDLLVMADPGDRVLGLHSNAGSLDLATALQALRQANADTENWWFGGGRLYEVSVEPIYFGAPSEGRVLGVLAVGSDIDERVARQVSQAAGIQVAFLYGDQIVQSTLPGDQTAALAQSLAATPDFAQESPRDARLGAESFLASSIAVDGNSARPVRLMVLKSLAPAHAFVHRLDLLLLSLGLLALLAGSLIVFIVSRTFTRPLDRLVLGVRALGGGDYEYPLPMGGNDEVAELTSAFARMRSSLQETQRELLRSERLATIGRMASSISHDLRHHLVAVLANAEFLLDERSGSERQELYYELRAGVSQMTDLIDSLLELSRPRDSVRRSDTSLDDVIDRAVQTVRAYTQFGDIRIDVTGKSVHGPFDSSKLQRVFQNLLVNACEAIPPDTQGHIHVDVREHEKSVEVRISDNGRGVPEAFGDRIFDAFVSHGKENGTGLGLTVVRKIIEDHGGKAFVESTGPTGTVVFVRLPLSDLADASRSGTRVAVTPGGAVE